MRFFFAKIGVSDIDQQVSDAVADILDRLLPEIKQTELAARATLPLWEPEVELVAAALADLERFNNRLGRLLRALEQRSSLNL